MTNLCTKVTVRQRPISKGQISLYLDFYPPIRNPKTGKPSRREYLGLYIYAKPEAPFQQEFNKSMLQKAELIKCRRTESIINEEFGFLDRTKGKEDFIEYWQKKRDETNSGWQTAINHFKDYSKGSCRFCDLSVPYCQGFHDWLMSQKAVNKDTTMKATTANGFLVKLKTILRLAFEDGHLKENIAPKLKRVKAKNARREFCTLDEVIALANAPCAIPALKSAGLFSCLTGLRISDIRRLKWKNIVKTHDGWALEFTTQKTDCDALLPLSQEAVDLCGERGEPEENVFKGLKHHVIQKNLKPWIEAAGITKHITFHCFRHTYATLQVSAGTDIYIISKMLTHSNVTVTQVYADVVNEKKQEAANKISLKKKVESKASEEDAEQSSSTFSHNDGADVK